MPKKADNKTFDKIPLLRFQALQGADDLGKYPAAMNVRHQNNRCLGVNGHPQVDDVIIHQIDFGARAGAFQNKQIVFVPQPVQCSGSGAEKSIFFAVIVSRCSILADTAQQHDLRPDVAGGLEQHGIHIHMRCNPGRFGLNDLSAPHLESFRCHTGIVGHILGFIWCGFQALTNKIATKCRDDNAFADIRPRPHDGDTGSVLFGVFHILF